MKLRSGKLKKNVQRGIRKTRSGKTKKTVQSDRGDSSTSTSLDENLWGTLQHHIDLAENVYSKLPFEEFFHLRAVCKDWYVIACKRLGLKEPIHKPFFCSLSNGEIIFYNALSRCWDWRGHPKCPTQYDVFQPVASKGMVFAFHCRPSANYLTMSVFHWQSKEYQTLVLPPTLIRTNGTIFGVIVSENGDPFTSIKVVLGSQDFDTQVHESGVWQTKPCRVPRPNRGAALQRSTGCVDCNGRIYITTEQTREIFVYDFEKSRWSSLFSPSDGVSHLAQDYCLDTLGAWNGRIFDVTCDFESGRQKKVWSLQVWELVDEALHDWKVYDCMPKDLCSWLRPTGGFRDPLKRKAGDICMQASFCGDFLLVYAWDYVNSYAERFCLFNMATKNWQKLLLG